MSRNEGQMVGEGYKAMPRSGTRRIRIRARGRFQSNRGA